MGEWVRVANQSDLPPGTAIVVEAKGKKIAVFNVDGRIYAINDQCPHAGGNLSEGLVAGTVVTCPWHAAEFDVTTGKVLCAPAAEDVQTYPVQLEDEEIKVEV